MTQVPMTLQEVFDKSVSAVLAQGECAVYNGTCAYLAVHGEKQTMCAVGHLLPDDETRAKWDRWAINGYSWFRKIVEEPGYGLAYTSARETWEKIGLPLTLECAGMLSDLQDAHDRASENPDREMDVFRFNAGTVAIKYGLSSNVINGA